MKIITSLTAAAMLLLSAAASSKTIEVEVNGLVCAFCAQGIEKTLRAFPATEDVFVSLEHRLVAVALKDGQTIDEATLKAAITDAGYTAVDLKYTDSTLETLRSAVHNQSDGDE